MNPRILFHLNFKLKVKFNEWQISKQQGILRWVETTHTITKDEFICLLLNGLIIFISIINFITTVTTLLKIKLTKKSWWYGNKKTKNWDATTTHLRRCVLRPLLKTSKLIVIKIRKARDNNNNNSSKINDVNYQKFFWCASREREKKKKGRKDTQIRFSLISSKKGKFILFFKFASL